MATAKLRVDSCVWCGPCGFGTSCCGRGVSCWCQESFLCLHPSVERNFPRTAWHCCFSVRKRLLNRWLSVCKEGLPVCRANNTHVGYSSRGLVLCTLSQHSQQPAALSPCVITSLCYGVKTSSALPSTRRRCCLNCLCVSSMHAPGLPSERKSQRCWWLTRLPYEWRAVIFASRCFCLKHVRTPHFRRSLLILAGFDFHWGLRLYSIETYNPSTSSRRFAGAEK